MTGLLIAFRFLTIIPLPFKENKTPTERDIAASAQFFPVIGLFQGLFLYASFLLLSMLLPADITAASIILLSVSINGGFHLDGLADTFDALASRKERDEMLRIMKDSTTGPAGVTAIIAILALKYLALKNLLSVSIISPLLLFGLIGRWAMVAAMSRAKSAASKGLGKMFIEHTDTIALLKTTIFSIIAVFLTFYIESYILYIVKLIPLLFLLSLCTIASTSFFEKKFGGLTGDNIGATGEITEVLFLLLFTIYI